MELVIDSLEDLLSRALNRRQEIWVFQRVYEEAIARAENYLSVFHDPDIIKIAGYYTFWFRKIKPFFVVDSEGQIDCEFLYVNEACALFFGISLIAQEAHLQGRTPSLSASFINDLIVSLRYNTFSPQSLTMLFAALDQSWQ